MEEKNKVLQENETLLELHRDLLITHVITSEEFWIQHTSQYTQAQKTPGWEIGVNNTFLADSKS